MKSLFSLAFFAFFFFIISCSSQKSNVYTYLNFRLGETATTATKKKDELIRQNKLNEKDGVLYCSETVSQNGSKYFSTPIFQIEPGQNLISKIRVLYFDNLEFTNDISKDTKEATTGEMMYLSAKANGESSPGFFAKLDILDELTKKYGGHKDIETTNLMGIYKEVYKWQTDGISIELVYAVWKADVENSSLRVDYTYQSNRKP